MPERLLTKAEFARYHCVSEGTIDAWVRRNKVTPIRTPGGYPRFLPPPDWSPKLPEPIDWPKMNVHQQLDKLPDTLYGPIQKRFFNTEQLREDPGAPGRFAAHLQSMGAVGVVEFDPELRASLFRWREKLTPVF